MISILRDKTSLTFCQLEKHFSSGESRLLWAIHERVEWPKALEHEGSKWVYHSYDGLRKLIGKSRTQTHTYLSKLRELGVLIVEKIRQSCGIRMNHYRIDYDRFLS